MKYLTLVNGEPVQSDLPNWEMTIQYDAIKRVFTRRIANGQWEVVPIYSVPLVPNALRFLCIGEGWQRQGSWAEVSREAAQYNAYVISWADDEFIFVQPIETREMFDARQIVTEELTRTAESPT